jgi:hypothetical protein
VFCLRSGHIRRKEVREMSKRKSLRPTDIGGEVAGGAFTHTRRCVTWAFFSVLTQERGENTGKREGFICNYSTTSNICIRDCVRIVTICVLLCHRVSSPSCVLSLSHSRAPPLLSLSTFVVVFSPVLPSPGVLHDYHSLCYHC